MVEKAKIKVLDGTPTEISVMYNPDQYTTTYKIINSRGEGTAATPQFRRVEMEDLTVDLFFDTYEKQTDVREAINPIVDLCNPTVPSGQVNKPPRCLFVWGGFSYQGYVIQVDQKFTMFLESGIPVRCDLRVKFQKDLPKEQVERDTGRNACRKLWIVKSGDRLDLIAHQTYKDSAQWRKIAEANSITNPLAFPTEGDIGRFLVIPDWGT